jgi:hypothetical protein
VSVDFQRRYFGTFFEESPKSNRLSMDETQGITQVFASGMSQRQIDRSLGIDRKSVARELRSSGAKGATDDKAPTGSEGFPSDCQTILGSCLVTQDAEGTGTIIKKSLSRSQCAQFHELIVKKLDSGLDAQRIYQDLARDHDFPGKYYSVRRYVQKLGQRISDPVRCIESAPGEQLHVDYGMGAKCKDHTGKFRKPYLFRCVLSHSRKGYTEAVTRLTTESFIRSQENAIKAMSFESVALQNAHLANWEKTVADTRIPLL